MSKSFKTRNLINQIAQNRIVQHILFWGLSIYVLFKLFNINEHMQSTDFIYTLLFHISLGALVYLNILLLIPRLLSKNYYLLFLLGSALLIAGMSLLNQFTFNTLADWIFPGYYFISYYSYWNIFQFMAAYWAISTTLKLAKSWFVVNEKEKQIRTLEQKKTHAELQALKAQLNPHFLFNSLNNIYSLALYEDKKTPEALLQLSQCLRYVLYDCKVPLIKLSKEIEMLQNYLDLQQIRSDKIPDLTFTVEGDPADIELAPLLFLPLIENAFKHSKTNPDGKFYINMKLSILEKHLVFFLENSQRPKSINRKDYVGGVGIENLKQRLLLLYPQRHQMEISSNATHYQTQLNIQL